MTACGTGDGAQASAGQDEVANDTAAPHSIARRADGLRPGMIPWRGAGSPALVTPTCSSPKLAYYDGPIMQNPVVVAVFWSSAVNAEVIKNMAAFYGDVTQTTYWSWLQEYDTVGVAGGSGQVILPTVAPTGTFADGVTLLPSKCATASKCTLSDAQVQTELNAQIEAGHLPEPTLDCTGNTNTVYMVHFPPNVTVTGPEGSGSSCVQFCGYHNTGTIASGAESGKPLVYGVLMDTYSGGCSQGCGDNAAGGGFTAAFNNQTSISSHELVDSVTDPDIGLLPASATSIAAPVAWYDENNQCGEIGDICDTPLQNPTVVGAHGTWTVQYLWSNKQNACVGSGTTLPVCVNTVSATCRECSCGDDGVDCPAGTSCGASGACVGVAQDGGADAGGTTPDGGNEGGNAAEAGNDSDAGTDADSGTVAVDSGAAPTDSGTMIVDSGSQGVDSSAPAVDSGSPSGEDSSVAQMDASGDAASEPDGATAGRTPGSNGGCGCRTAGARQQGGIPAVLGLGLALALSRLRGRRKVR